jgi:hypothetical protein
MTGFDPLLDHAAVLSSSWDEMAASAFDFASDRFDRARDRFHRFHALARDQKAASETLQGQGHQT